jgi:flagellar hook-basal body complex protein FliE
MSIPSISSIVGAAATPPVASVASTTQTASVDGGSSFGSALINALNSVQSTQATADQLNIQAVTGTSTDIASATIASTRAQVEVQLVSAVRNQSVDAFNSIMNMSA